VEFASAGHVQHCHNAMHSSGTPATRTLVVTTTATTFYYLLSTVRSVEGIVREGIVLCTCVSVKLMAEDIVHVFVGRATTDDDVVDSAVVIIVLQSREDGARMQTTKQPTWTRTWLTFRKTCSKHQKLLFRVTMIFLAIMKTVITMEEKVDWGLHLRYLTGWKMEGRCVNVWLIAAQPIRSSLMSPSSRQVLPSSNAHSRVAGTHPATLCGHGEVDIVVGLSFL
jgi:hypothetical protein